MPHVIEPPFFMAAIDAGPKNSGLVLAKVDPRNLGYGFEIIDWECIQNQRRFPGRMTPEMVADASVTQFAWLRSAWKKHVGDKQAPLVAMEWATQGRGVFLGNMYQLLFLLDHWSKGNCHRLTPSQHLKFLREHVGIDLLAANKNAAIRGRNNTPRRSSNKDETMAFVDRLFYNGREGLKHPARYDSEWQELTDSATRYNHVADACSVALYAAYVYYHKPKAWCTGRKREIKPRKRRRV